MFFFCSAIANTHKHIRTAIRNALAYNSKRDRSHDRFVSINIDITIGSNIYRQTDYIAGVSIFIQAFVSIIWRFICAPMRRNLNAKNTETVCCTWVEIVDATAVAIASAAASNKFACLEKIMRNLCIGNAGARRKKQYSTKFNCFIWNRKINRVREIKKKKTAHSFARAVVNS